MARRHSVVHGPLYSRMVALFHETGIKGKSCTCDYVSNHVMCVSVSLARLRNSIRIVRFSRLLRLLNPFTT
jgi:hypothetical protein